MAESITVTVRAFGSSADVLGWNERRMEVAGGARLADLIERLESDCTPLAEARGRLTYAVNLEYATGETALRDGDEVAIIPPVSGGAPPMVECRLTREPIDVAGLISEVSPAPGGAIGVFLGVVRPETDASNRPLRALEYSAYEPMALRELERITERAAREFAVLAARVVHRLGTLGIGEASVAVVVATGHRAESFDACRQIIEELKVRVPIFKRELWEDGSSTWVEPAARG